MAEKKDRFSRYITDEDSSGLEGSGFNTQPITPSKRLILNNLFDTNDEQRKAFLKQLGWEVDPLDDSLNMIRPIGSESDYIPIDPGFSDAYKKGGLKGLSQELSQDFWDIAYDAGDIGAKALGILGGAGAGMGVASIPAAMAGAALAGAASSAVKQNLRKLYLDEEIDFDQKEAMIEGVLSGLGAGVFKGGGKVLKKIGEAFDGHSIESIKKAVANFGSEATPELIEKAARNPEKFSREAVEGGTKRLNEVHKGIFGLGEDESMRSLNDIRRIRKDSFFGGQLSNMMERRDEALNVLAADPNANVSYKDAMGQLQQMYDGLSQKIGKYDTPDDVQALKSIGEQMNKLKNIAADNIGKNIDEVTDKELMNATINFDQANKWVDSLEAVAYDKATKSQNPVINQAAGGMNNYLKQVAEKSGNDLGPQYNMLNEKMHTAINDYNQLKKELTPTKLVKTFVGGKTTSSEMEGQNIKAMLERIDNAYGLTGTDQSLTKNLGDLTDQSVIEQVYSGTVPKGSSKALPLILGEAGKEAMKYGGLGAGAGSVIPGIGYGGGAVTGMLYGGAKGLKEASQLAIPEKAIETLGQKIAKQSAAQMKNVTGESTEELIRGALGAGTAAQVATGLNPYDGKPVQEQAPSRRSRYLED